MKSVRNLNTKTKSRPPGPHETKECAHKLHGALIHHQPKRAVEGKILFNVNNADGTQRELFIPDKKNIDVPGIFSKTEYERLNKNAKVVTLEDRLRMKQDADNLRDKLEMESQKRKDVLIKAQQNLQKAAEASVDNEAAKKTQMLLNRSNDLITEQDERVKAANSLILATKCRAIRFAQISEKEEILKQIQNEDKRLDMMMEKERLKKIEIEDKKKDAIVKKNQRHVSEILGQIKENENERLLKAQRIEEESKMQNKALLAMQRDEAEKVAATKLKQKKMREEFMKASSEAERLKNLQEEEQRIADLRVQEFMRKKAEREEVREHEEKLAKEAKEKEIAKLRVQQERAADRQAQKDELNALRTQEEKEKQFREKEKEAAIKRKYQMEQLKADRAKQVEDIRASQARAIMRDETDFHKVARIQRELHDKEMNELRRKRQERVNHRKELLKQINEKEKERIQMQQEKFEEGRAQRLEVEVQDRCVANHLKKKVESLRTTDLGQNYIKDIARQLKIK